MRAGLGETVASLDVGDSRVLALVAEVEEGGDLVIRGAGVAKLEGALKAGQVVDFLMVVNAIRDAVQEAETLAHKIIEKVWVSVGGDAVVGRFTTTTLQIGKKARPVSPQDLARLWEAARWQNLPPGHFVLNVLPHCFTLNDQEHLVNPEGMEGTQLSMNALVLSTREGPIRTLSKAINQAGLQIQGFLYSPVASSLAVLTTEEKAIGSLVVDMGHSTTAYALWYQGHVMAAGAIPYGASMVDQDLVQYFGTTFPAAEEVKLRKLTLLAETIDLEEVVNLPTLDGRPRNVSRREACTVAAARVAELLRLVGLGYTQQLTQEVRLLSVVLCGGGSHLEGITEKASEVFGCPGRLGDPRNFIDATGCLTEPPFPLRSAACAIGLLHYGSQTNQGSISGVSGKVMREKSSLWERLLGRWKKEVSHDHF
ncbi:MAG: cell division protein FtsA [Thermoanaerobaculaceae bacterium]